MTKKNHFFKFIEGLRLHESRKADHFHSLIHGVSATRFQKNDLNKQREQKIKSCTDKWLNETFSVAQFLQAMSDDDNGKCDWNIVFISYNFFNLILFIADIHDFDSEYSSDEDEEEENSSEDGSETED